MARDIGNHSSQWFLVSITRCRSPNCSSSQKVPPLDVFIERTHYDLSLFDVRFLLIIYEHNREVFEERRNAHSIIFCYARISYCWNSDPCSAYSINPRPLSRDDRDCVCWKYTPIEVGTGESNGVLLSPPQLFDISSIKSAETRQSPCARCYRIVVLRSLFVF